MVVSAIRGTPLAWAISESFLISATNNCGLVMISKNSAAVLSSICASTSSGFVKTTKRYSTPKLPKVSRISETLLPNRCFEATIFRPAPLTAVRA